MIDQSKLNALSIETLQALKTQVTDTILRKQRQEMRLGSVWKFDSAKQCREVRIKITGRGPKNVMGVEIKDDGTEGGKWTVSPQLLSPVTAVPQTVGAGSF